MNHRDSCHIETNHVFVNGEKGFLHGELKKCAESRALVMIVRDTHGHNLYDQAMVEAFLRARLSVFVVDLLSASEVIFPDHHHNVPLLSKRLMLFMDSLDAQFDKKVLPHQSIIIYASGNLSPVAIRSTVLRDQEVLALACKGGLIDLAGARYLRALTTPILVCVDQQDTDRVRSNERALKEITSCQQLVFYTENVLPEDEGSECLKLSKAILNWFECYLPK